MGAVFAFFQNDSLSRSLAAQANAEFGPYKAYGKRALYATGGPAAEWVIRNLAAHRPTDLADAILEGCDSRVDTLAGG
jgi:hypothetical protein